MTTPYERRLIKNLLKKKVRFKDKTGIELTDPEIIEFMRRVNKKKMPSVIVGVIAILGGFVVMAIGTYNASYICLLCSQAETQAVNNQDAMWQLIAITGFVTGILVGLVIIAIPSAIIERRLIPVFAEEIKRRRGQSA